MGVKIKDQRTRGDQQTSFKPVSKDIPYYSIVWYDGEERMSYALSNDPIEAKSMFEDAVWDGLIIDEGPEDMTWINIRSFPFAYLRKFNPGE